MMIVLSCGDTYSLMVQEGNVCTHDLSSVPHYIYKHTGISLRMLAQTSKFHTCSKTANEQPGYSFMLYTNIR